jgi:hypothetical protein
MQWVRKHPWLTAVGIVAVVAIVLAAASYLAPLYGRYCYKDEYSGQKECPSRHLVYVVIVYVWQFLSDASVAITAFATVLLAIITYMLVKLGIDQGETTRKQMRAYLGVGSGSIRKFSGKLQARIDIPNKGQTPAHNVRRFIDMKIESPKCASFGEAPQEKGSWVIIPEAYWTLTKEMDVDEKDLANIEMEDRTVFVWGKVVYDTIYERDRVAEFRYRLWLKLFEEQRVPVTTSNLLGVERVHIGWALDPCPEGNHST